MKRTFPAALYGQSETLVIIDTAMIPIVSGVLEPLLQSSVWQTQEDYAAGYDAVARIMASMGGNTLAELIRVQKATYRLLEARLNGAEHVLDGEGMPPEVPDVPGTPDGTPDSIASLVSRLWQLGENAATSREFLLPSIDGMTTLDAAGGWAARLGAVQGTKDASWFGGGTPVTLSDLYRRSGVVSETDEGLVDDGIQEVLSTLASGGSVGEVLAELFSTAVDTATDGGVVATLIAAAVAQSAIAGAQAAQIDSLIAELRATNRRMFGSDATGAAALPAELPAVRDALVQTLPDDAGGVVLQGFAEYFARYFNPSQRAELADQQNAIEASINVVAARVYDNVTRNTLGDTAGNMRLALSQVVANTGQTAARVEPVQAVLDAIGALPPGPDPSVTVRGWLELIEDNTLRAAECCEDDGGGASYPDPEGLGCEDYPVHALTGVVSFDGPGGTGSVTWSEGTDSGPLNPVSSGPLSLLQTTTGPRTVCIVLAYPIGSTPPPGGVSGNFTPYRVSDTATAARATVSYTGSSPGTYGDFYPDEVGTSELIGYALSLGLAPGESFDGLLRLYVYRGALG